MTPDLYCSLVAEFHLAFKYCQPEPQEPFLSDVENNKLRVTLIEEEFKAELLPAIEVRDRLQILDALCDIQYVLSGAVLCLGFRKVWDPAVKLKYATIPTQDYLVARIDNNLLACRIFGVALSNFDSNLRTKHPHGVLSAMASMQFVLDRLIRLTGFTMVFPDAFKEVHRANLDKLFTREQMERYYTEVVPPNVKEFEPSGDKFIVRRLDGKILKPIDHVSPQLAQFL